MSLRLSVAERGLPGGSAGRGGEHSPPLTGDGPKEPFWLSRPEDSNAWLPLYVSPLIVVARGSEAAHANACSRFDSCFKIQT